MTTSTPETASLDHIEREKSMQKDTEVQLENASDSKTIPIADESVNITPKTWWVIFVS
jgi:anti-sigma factor ChrR (cupin superfamily)